MRTVAELHKTRVRPVTATERPIEVARATQSYFLHGTVFFANVNTSRNISVVYRG